MVQRGVCVRQVRAKLYEASLKNSSFTEDLNGEPEPWFCLLTLKLYRFSGVRALDYAV